jgi:glycogen debranching enzyme
MARYGERRGVVHITTSMFESASQFEMRLPELFCGFPREAGDPPVAYPVACLPQAWAAGAVFMLLQACLGVRVDGEAGVIEVKDPRLPIGIDHFALLKLSLDDDLFDLHFERAGAKITVRSTSPKRLRRA